MLTGTDGYYSLTIRIFTMRNINLACVCGSKYSHHVRVHRVKSGTYIYAINIKGKCSYLDGMKNCVGIIIMTIICTGI